MKRKISKIILTTLASTLLLFSATALAAPEGTRVVATQADGFVDAAATLVTSEEVAIHSAPTDDSSVVAVLPAGTSLARVAVNPESGWVRVSYGGQTCYVWYEYVQTAQASVTEQADDSYVQAVGNMNVRSEPGSEGILLGTFENGQVAHRVAVCSNGWSKIEFDGGYGYIGGQIIGVSAPETEAQTEASVETPAQTEAPVETQAQTEAPVETEAPTETVAPTQTETTVETTEEETEETEVETEETTVTEETTDVVETTEEESTEAKLEETTQGTEDTAEAVTEESTVEANKTTGDPAATTSDPTATTSDPAGKNTQVSIWKMIFFVFIVLLVINTIILVATVLKKDTSAAEDEADEEEETEEDDSKK